MLSFGNSSGNLFNILGKAGLVIKQLRSYQNSQKTNFIDTAAGLVAQLNAQSDVQAIVGNSYIGALNNAGTAGTTVAQVAQKMINRLVFLDNPRLNQDLQSVQLDSSVAEVIRQMKVAGATILAQSITAVPSAFTGTGNGVVVASSKRPLDGLVLENAFTENLLVTCSRDSYSGGSGAGNESFLLTGTGSQTNVFAFNWPLGSNASTFLSAINGRANASQGNILTNSGFDSWTSGSPNNFSVDVGTTGTNYAQETTLVYDGAGALKIIGDGSNLTQFRQQFANSIGTSAGLLPLTQYAVNLWARRDGVAAGQGVLTIDLVDSGGNIITDANGAGNSFTVNLTTLTVNYAAFNGVFRTPEILPTSQYLRLRLSTALSASRAVYLDKMSMGQMTQAYTSGPWVSVHSGNTPFVSLPIGDFATIAVTNSRGAGGTLDSFQTLFFRLTYPNSLNNEYLLPSSPSPSISDALIG